MSDWGRICIGTRLEKQVDSAFVEAWSLLLAKGQRKGDGYIIIRDRVAHTAANDLVRGFLKTGCDTLFMLDSDADVGPNFLNEFRDYQPGWEYDVLQAFYPRRGWPPEAIWFKRTCYGDSYQVAVYGEDIITDVSIVGTHSVLIRRSVFEKLLGDDDPETHDWFFYPRHQKVSEDAAFSKEALAAGFRLGATTHVKAGHISRITTGWETYQEYMELSGSNAWVRSYEAMVQRIAVYTGETPDLVQAKIMRFGNNLKGEWTSGSIEHERELYGKMHGYIYELAAWNYSGFYAEIVNPLREVKGKRVLVVGSGIGGEVERLSPNNQVEAYDLPGVLRDFCQARFQWLHFAERLEGEYDLVVMVDVVEHIHPDEFDAEMDAIAGLAPEFYIHHNFGQRHIYPMHYDHNGRFDAWVERHGLKREGEYLWRK